MINRERGKPSQRLVLILLLCVSSIIVIGNFFARNSTVSSSPEEKEIVILMPHSYSPYDSYVFLDRYRQSYEAKTGTKVRIERITAGNYDRYVLKKNSRLYMKEGPTLLLIPYHEYARDLVEKGIALDLEGKIPNQGKLYSGLQDNFYLPVKIHGKTVSLNRNFLERIGATDLGLDWTIEDHDFLWEKWVESETVLFNKEIFFTIFEMKSRGMSFINPETNRVSFNNEDVRTLIKEIEEEIFSGRYLLNQSFTYENYERMFFHEGSMEDRISWSNFMRNSPNNFILNTVGHHYNSLSTPRISRIILHIKTSLILPDIRGNMFHTIGFVVNKNGKNTEQGLDFLNYLISDEIQLDIFMKEAGLEDSTNGIVNKAIEHEIQQIEKQRAILEEAIILREYMQDILEQENIKDIYYGPHTEIEAVKMGLLKAITKIIFTDEPYTNEEMGKLLKKAEDELTIYINE